MRPPALMSRIVLKFRISPSLSFPALWTYGCQGWVSHKQFLLKISGVQKFSAPFYKNVEVSKYASGGEAGSSPPACLPHWNNKVFLSLKKGSIPWATCEGRSQKNCSSLSQGQCGSNPCLDYSGGQSDGHDEGGPILPCPTGKRLCD